MEKKKARKLFFIGSILFLVGAITWGTIVLAIPRVDYTSGSKLGSLNKDIVLHFKATSSRDYWEISYTTSGYYAVIYKFDECNYEAYLNGQPLNPYETLINDQITPIKLKINSSNCKMSRDIYIVWNFWKGIGISVVYEAKEAHFFGAIGMLIYFCTGFPVFGIGLLTTTNFPELRLKNAQNRTMNRKNQIVEKKKRRNLIECAFCGNDISLISEYCIYCGTQTSLGRRNKSKIDYDSFNSL